MSIAGSERYNIVYVVIDCLRSSNLGCYSYNRQTSPNIDKLADSGLVFEDAYCSTNHTDPSLTSMMSGRYPLSNGIIHHGFEIEEREKDALEATNTVFLPEILNAFEYATYGLSDLHRWHKRGFDFYGDKPGMVTGGSADQSLLQRTLDPVKSSVRDLKPHLPNTVYDVLEDVGRRAGVVNQSGNASDLVDMTINLLQRDNPDDFFALLHFNDAHYPYDLPNELFEQFNTISEVEKTPIDDLLGELPDSGWRRRAEKINLRGIDYIEDIPAYYDAGIRYVDRELARLISYLETRSGFDDTIFVITGDHGDNVLWKDSFFGHHGLYDPVIHVPLILTGGPFESSRRVDGFVQHLDVVPTLLETIGIDPKPYDFDGVCLSQPIEGSTEDFRDEVLVMDPISSDRFALKDDEYKLICSLQGDEPFLADVSGQNPVELYRTDSDEERQNLADEFPDVVKTYRERMEWLVRDQRKKRQQRSQFVNRIREAAISPTRLNRGEGSLANRLIEGLDLLPHTTDAEVNQAALTNAVFMDEGASPVGGDDDEAQVEERLRNLGYIE